MGGGDGKEEEMWRRRRGGGSGVINREGAQWRVWRAKRPHLG